jgi:hypothetical protein
LSNGAKPIARLEWVKSMLGDAACLTWVSGADLSQVADAYGGDWGRRRRMNWRQLSQVSTLTHPLVGLKEVGDWILAVEFNGWQGSRAEILDPASATGTAVSCYWSVDGYPRFGIGHHRDVEVEQVNQVTEILARVEREIGVPLSRAMFAGWFAAVPITPRAGNVPATIDVLTHQFGGHEPTRAYHLAHAGPQVQRMAARQAAEHALNLSDLGSGQAVREALAHEPPQDSVALKDLLAEVQITIARSAEGRPPTELRTRYFALEAIREASSPDPEAAAFGALQAARTAALINHRLDDFRAVTDQVLGSPPAPAGSLGLVAADDGTPGSRYRWIARHWLAAAGGLVAVPTMEPVDVARALGPGYHETHIGVPELHDQSTVGVRVTSFGALLLDVSPRTALNGAVLAQVSAEIGPITWISWSARGRVHLEHAADGELAASLDPLSPEQRRRFPDAAFFDPYLRGLPLPLPGVSGIGHLPVLFTVFERITGVVFSPSDLDVVYTWWEPDGSGSSRPSWP